ncbi:hypothetical protein R3P38DRAFT_686961 [Favolaschia claudopus]|uniref:Uncharacterized protein n=1 Tax=Favolaschia claudopus TaxID=2862362 RepID=A0AAW0EDV4_9AGAR
MLPASKHPEPRILPPAGKSRSFRLKATSLRATLLVEAPRSGANTPVYIFRPAPFQISGLKPHPSPIPDIFGNLIFRRPASEVGERDEPKSSSSARAMLFRSSNYKIKIKISLSRRPPSAEFIRGRVQGFPNSSDQVLVNLSFNINGFQPATLQILSNGLSNSSAIHLQLQNFKYHPKRPTWWKFALHTANILTLTRQNASINASRRVFSLQVEFLPLK